MGPDGFQSWKKNKGWKSRDTLPLINQAMNKINSLKAYFVGYKKIWSKKYKYHFNRRSQSLEPELTENG